MAIYRGHFPWPETPTQQYDATLERIELERPYRYDDQWVVPHNLELAVYSPANINVLPFDLGYGADQSRQYACKYCGKPEPYYFVEAGEGDANPVTRYLKTRNVGH